MTSEILQVRGRFAPSPSGEMHIGNAWTALMAWLQVRKAGGTMVLRIEDLDPQRSRSEYIRLIQEDLTWLGLDWDEGPGKEGVYGPYLQSKRSGLYAEVLDKLKTAGYIYPCFCTRSDIRSASQAPHGVDNGFNYPGTCRDLNSDEIKRRILKGERFSLRFRLSQEKLEFTDLVFGPHFTTKDSGDFIVLRSDGIFAYQLAVVADDANMQISHVLRGADLLDATIYQVALYRALNIPQPLFAHIPIVFGPDGRRLSKRQGDVSLHILRKRGTKAENILGLFAYWAKLLPKPEAVKAKELIPLFNVNSLSNNNIFWNTDDPILKHYY